MREIPKPEGLAAMTVIWFAANDDGDEVHVFKEENIGPNSAAQHLCLEVDDIEAYKTRLREHGYEVRSPRRSITAPPLRPRSIRQSHRAGRDPRKVRLAVQLRGLRSPRAGPSMLTRFSGGIPVALPKRSPTPRLRSRSSRCTTPSTLPRGTSRRARSDLPLAHRRRRARRKRHLRGPVTGRQPDSSLAVSRPALKPTSMTR